MRVAILWRTGPTGYPRPDPTAAGSCVQTDNLDTSLDMVDPQVGMKQWAPARPAGEVLDRLSPVHGLTSWRVAAEACMPRLCL